MLKNAPISSKSSHFDYLTSEDKGRAKGKDSTALIDGDPLTAWITSSGRFPHYIIFELPKEVSVNRIGFVNHFSGHAGDKGNNYAKDITFSFAGMDGEFKFIGKVQLKGAAGNPPPQYSKLQSFTFNSLSVKFVLIQIESNYFLPTVYEQYPDLIDALGVSLGEICLFAP